MRVIYDMAMRFDAQVRSVDRFDSKGGLKIVVIRPSAGSRDCAHEVRYIECAQRHLRCRRADQEIDGRQWGAT